MNKDYIKYAIKPSEKLIQKTKDKMIKKKTFHYKPMIYILAFSLILLVIGIKTSNPIDKEPTASIKPTTLETYPYSSLNIPLHQYINIDTYAAIDYMYLSNEEVLNDTENILEGTVTNVTKKTLTYLEKYGEMTSTQKHEYLVYEVKVKKLYYGKITQQTIFIEDRKGFSANWQYEKNHTYVFWINQKTEANSPTHNTMDSDTDLCGDYYTNYPFHYPIEITLDREYIIDKWYDSLANEQNTKLIIDDEITDPILKNLLEYETAGLYLIDEETFNERFEALLTTRTKKEE